MHGNSNLSQCVFPTPPFTVSGLQDWWFVRMGICNCYKLSISVVKIDQSHMIRKFIVALAMFCNCDSINLRKIPAIVMNPFHKLVTDARPSTYGELLPVFSKNLVTAIDYQFPVLGYMAHGLHAGKNTINKFVRNGVGIIMQVGYFWDIGINKTFIRQGTHSGFFAPRVLWCIRFCIEALACSVMSPISSPKKSFGQFRILPNISS